MTTRVPAVGAVVRDDGGRILLVLRGRPPGQGQWSLPGGRVEPGETAPQALVREVAEETGLDVVVTGRVGHVERDSPGGVVFDIEDFHARVQPGCDPHALRPGDDAADARWFTPDELRGLDCVEGLVDVLTGWGVLPAAAGEESAGT